MLHLINVMDVNSLQQAVVQLNDWIDVNSLQQAVVQLNDWLYGRFHIHLGYLLECSFICFISYLIIDRYID